MTEGTPPVRHGPMAGDRLPDARVRRGNRDTYLQQELSDPCQHLLLCGPVAAWNAGGVHQLRDEFRGVLGVTYLTSEDSDEALVDAGSEALRRLGVDGTAQYVIRPDGHVGFRCAGADLAGAADYLRRWFRSAPRE